MASKSTDVLTQAATGSNGNTTNQMIINQFKFAAAKSVRTSTIILATFNAVAAFATAMGILYDAYSGKRGTIARSSLRTWAAHRWPGVRAWVCH